ncbi:MAG: IS66 family insertion sequence hypothetical protein, partial [Desulfobacter postgatei]
MSVTKAESQKRSIFWSNHIKQWSESGLSQN